MGWLFLSVLCSCGGLEALRVDGPESSVTPERRTAIEDTRADYYRFMFPHQDSVSAARMPIF